MEAEASAKLDAWLEQEGRHANDELSPRDFASVCRFDAAPRVRPCIGIADGMP